uniref:restriction endonuclease subunit S n=1 Tax=Flavobacterium sp. TaxID=239 RepID=UPI00404B0427
MPSNYKRLGDYIQEVNIRNTDLKIDKLIGVSIEKKFISSVANIVGTDMSVYKVIKKNQLACKLMSVGRDEKLPIDLYLSDEPAIISSAYYVFESKNNKVLLPEYLKMWLFRKETDRYVGYISGGDVRGGISWDTFCDMPIIIPSVEKQQEIVREYNTIQNRIALNNQLLSILEETAQAIYKQWFVDFEFPDENGLPYKSNGGEMVWCAEMEKEIPEGWEYKPFTTVLKLSGGGTPSTVENDYWNGQIPFYTPGDLTNNYYSIRSAKHITELGLKNCSSKLYPVNTTFITARGATVGGVGLAGMPMAMNQTCYAVSSFNECNLFAHQLTKAVISEIKNEAIGATFEALVTKNFDYFLVINPKKHIVINFETSVKHLYQYMLIKSNENLKLEEFKELLMAKMTRIEIEKI